MDNGNFPLMFYKTRLFSMSGFLRLHSAHSHPPVTMPAARATDKGADGLTAEERKLNHVAAEKKRREAIRRGFDQITAVVPDLDHKQARSEALVLEKSKFSLLESVCI